VTHKYLYDSAGNLNCVMTSAWSGSTCPVLYYNVAPDPSLVTWNLFDSKNRLVGTWTFSSGTQTDGAVYTLDSLDRVLSESEWHSGVSSRTDFTFIGLSSAIGQEQHYDGSGNLTDTKAYVYDALGRPATLTDTPAGGSTGRYSYAFDPHGSVELVLDQNRTVQAAYGYTAYGSSNLSLTKTAAGFSPNTNAYQFQSERFDTGSRTIDFGARHYSPSMERFVQRDSYQSALDDLGLSTDPLNGNRYVLTGANPINFVDLDGHKGSIPCWGNFTKACLHSNYGTGGPPTTHAPAKAVAGAGAVVSAADKTAKTAVSNAGKVLRSSTASSSAKSTASVVLRKGGSALKAAEPAARAAGAAAVVASGYLDYTSARKQGYSKPGAAGKAAVKAVGGAAGAAAGGFLCGAITAGTGGGGAVTCLPLIVGGGALGSWAAGKVYDPAAKVVNKLQPKAYRVAPGAPYSSRSGKRG